MGVNVVGHKSEAKFKLRKLSELFIAIYDFTPLACGRQLCKL